MTIDAVSGPLVVFQDGGIIANSSANQNPDQGPSLILQSIALLDPRAAYTFYPGSTNNIGNVKPAVGWLNNWFQVADYAPGTASTTSLASSVSITATTTVPLITASASNITVGDSTTNPQTGAVVTSLWRIDNKPGNITFGQSGAVAIWDPANPPIGRAVNITAVGGSLTAITFTVSGLDAYGNPILQTLSGGTTSTGVTTSKTFKWISSVTASATSSTTVSVGVADVYGFPMLATAVAYTDMTWNNVSAPTNTTVTGTFLAGVTTTTAGAGDVRGTINPSNIAVSNGTLKMQLWQAVAPANIASGQGVNSIFGVIPA